MSCRIAAVGLPPGADPAPGAGREKSGITVRRSRFPVQHFEFSTDDPDLAQQEFRRVNMSERPIRFAPTSSSFWCETRSMRAGRITAGSVCMPMPAQALVPPVDQLTVVVSRAPSGHFATATQSQTLGGGDVVRYPTDEEVSRTWDALDAVFLKIPTSAVTEVAADRFGIDQVLFTSIFPASAAMADYWRGVNDLVHAGLACPDSPVGIPLVESRLVELIVAAALAVFPNNTMRRESSPGPGWVRADVAARAAAFIEANADAPIGVARTAAAVGVNSAALRAAFRRHRNCSVEDYLRRVRLHRAHDELQAADPSPGVTVADIATRWGFRSPARFTSSYQAVFGTTPENTLHG